ncbi:MAG: hypothetical protein K1W35_25420 [Lachnospiraceae bacterium]
MKILDKNRKIVLYGAGQKTHNVYNAFCMSGYTIAYCVVTNAADGVTDFERVKVYPFVEKKDEIVGKRYQLVIASAQKSENDIAENIEKNGLNEYWRTNELPWSASFDNYKELDSEGYLNIIKRKYYSDEKRYGTNECIKSFIENDKVLPAKEGKLLFLLTCASPRAYKIIDALHRNGYDVEVIMWANAMYLTSERNQEFEEISNQFHLCIDVEEVMLYCAVSGAEILHIFSDANSDIELPQILINCKEVFPKIIFDEYDIMVGMRRDIPQKTVDAEIFCLQYADGLCNRYTCMEYLEDKGYEICKKRIYFIDCCNDLNKCFSLQKSDKDDLHLVFAGGLFSGKEYKSTKDGRFLEFGEICKENRVHLHLYPVSYDVAKLHDYIDMEKTNSYFHLHHPVSARKMAQELCQYDYGVAGVQMGILEYAEKNGSWKKESYIYSSTNKMYDYLDAGLPIVTVIPVKQTEMLEKDGVLIRKYDEEIDFDELREKRNELKKRVLKIREKYEISNQLPALIAFYNSFKETL